jgi:hypothetical protein
MNPNHAVRFTLRLQFGLHQDADAMSDRLVKLCRDADVDEVMLFFFGEELNDGHEPLSRTKQWIEKSRVNRRKLDAIGVDTSLNPWHSILHCDRGRSLKPGQKWRNMVDHRGRAATAVVCPLDPEWQKYYEETLRMYAAEKFRVIWIDDDIRFHNHAPLEWGGCFCPLHVAEFNRRAGVNATREEIVANCVAPGAPHPWREIWLDSWQENHLAMIGRWRDIAAAHGVRLGLMSSRMEPHAAEGRRWQDWWTAFGRPPAHRPHFWDYGDMMGWSLPGSLMLMDQNRGVQPDQCESGPEIECMPYGRWNKSYRQTCAQMNAAVLHGSDSLNISLYDFMGNHPDDDPSREQFLRAYRGAAERLAHLFPRRMRAAGIGLPWSQGMGRKVRTAPGSTGWKALECPGGRGWATWLNASGFACAPSESPAVNALSGPAAWAFDDDAIKHMCSAGLFIDGPAASVLIDRGFGPLIGLKRGRFVTQDDVLYSVENVLDAAFGPRAGAQMSLNAGWMPRLFLAEALPAARAVSDIRGPLQNVVGLGVTLFENSLGGRIAVAPWTPGDPTQVNPQRAVQLAAVSRWLSKGRALGAVRGGPWLLPQFFTDGNEWRAVVWNASPDEAAEFELDCPAGMAPPRQALYFAPPGRMTPADVRGSRVVLSESMHQWEMVVLW